VGSTTRVVGQAGSWTPRSFAAVVEEDDIRVNLMHSDDSRHRITPGDIELNLVDSSQTRMDKSRRRINVNLKDNRGRIPLTVNIQNKHAKAEQNCKGGGHRPDRHRQWFMSVPCGDKTLSGEGTRCAAPAYSFQGTASPLVRPPMSVFLSPSLGPADTLPAAGAERGEGTGWDVCSVPVAVPAAAARSLTGSASVGSWLHELDVG
jgi:hypothetical protein